MTCTILVSKMPFGKKRKLCCKRKVLLKESKNRQQANYYWVGEGPQHVTLLQLSVRYSWLNSLCLSVSGDLFKNRDSLEVPKIIVFEEHVRSKLQLSSRARCRRRGDRGGDRQHAFGHHVPRLRLPASGKAACSCWAKVCRVRGPLTNMFLSDFSLFCLVTLCWKKQRE